MAHNDREGCNI